jgi:hypothetical protein
MVLPAKGRKRIVSGLTLRAVSPEKICPENGISGLGLLRTYEAGLSTILKITLEFLLGLESL